MKDFSKYIIHETANVREALVALNALSSNETLTLFILNKDDVVLGSLTDGDIRRRLIDGIGLDSKISEVANKKFQFIEENEICVEKIKKLKSEGIELLPIVDYQGKMKGVLNLKKKKSILPIDAILMAGGKGERLRPLTEKVPKPLLKVGDKTIIDYNTDSLIEYGVENIYVTINYLGEQIETHYKEPREQVCIKCVKEPRYLGTIGSIKFIKDFHHDTILLMNSDLFTNINYEDFFLHFQKNNADMSVATIPYSVTVPYGIFDLEERNIKGIKEKPTLNFYANSGIYLIKTSLLSLIPEDTFFNATDFINILLEKGYNVIRFPLVGYWIDIGKPEDYKKAQDFVKHL